MNATAAHVYMAACVLTDYIDTNVNVQQTEPAEIAKEVSVNTVGSHRNRELS